MTKSADPAGPFAGLTVSVNQTQHLNHQAVSVSWIGGKPTDSFSTVGNGYFNTNFVQIFQCWGDDPAGPPPDQCEVGAYPIGDVTGRLPVDPQNAASNVYSRIIGSVPPGTVLPPDQGYAAPNGIVWRPFRAVDGGLVNAEAVAPDAPGGCIQNPPAPTICSIWKNNYFDFTTSNEDAFAPTHADGTGSELFQVDSGVQSNGLGCGAPQPNPNGTQTTHKCWLVIVPQGTTATRPAGDGQTSPLAPGPWQQRMVFPLDFNPVDTCGISAAARRIVGSELAVAAANNWARKLCSPPFHYAPLSDATARNEIVSKTTGAPGMAVVSKPLDPANFGPSSPIVYAPLTLSGLVIGFNIERVGQTFPNAPQAEADAEHRLLGVRLAHINLTPRLVAKLLTQSYRAQFETAIIGAPAQAPPAYVATNPVDLLADKDFLQYNPEFTVLNAVPHKNMGGLVVEFPSTDATYEMWRWVLADPEAKAWLAGGSDNNTPPMKVNPNYSTVASTNPNGGAFGAPIPDTFPKTDQYTLQDTSPADKTGNPPSPPRPLSMGDMEPYANNLIDAAQKARSGNDGAKDFHDPFNPSENTADTWWGSPGPQKAGSRGMLAVTDAGSAALFGLQTASLSRAGDDTGPGQRSFVAPDPTNLLAGEQAMIPSSVAGVLQPDPLTTPSGAYPLTLLSYAAVAPANLDTQARNDYAAYISYASGGGQTPGLDVGLLPPGYAPLPKGLQDQAQAAAASIRAFVAPSPGTPPPSSNTAPSSNTNNASTSGGQGDAGSAGATPTTAGPIVAQGASPSPPKIAPLPKGKAAPAGSVTHTPGDILGIIRYTLPIAVAVGIAAILLAQLLSKWQRRKDGLPDVGSPEPLEAT
jgi:hypothetical protein